MERSIPKAFQVIILIAMLLSYQAVGATTTPATSMATATVAGTTAADTKAANISAQQRISHPIQQEAISAAESLYNNGNHDAAIDAVEEYLSKDPTSSAAWGKSCLWNLQASIGAGIANSAASKVINEAPSKIVNEALSGAENGYVNNSSGNSMSGIAADKAPQAKPSVADALLDKAEYSCEKFAEFEPGDTAVHFYLSNIYMAKKWYATAFWHIGKGLELNTGNKSAVKVSNIEPEKLNSLLEAAKTNRYYLLSKLAEDNITIEAKIPIDYVDKAGNFLINQEELNKSSMAELTAEITSAPTSLAGYYNRGVLGLSLGSMQDVERDLIKVTELAPKWFAGYSALAAYYAKVKNYNQARVMLKQALEFKPDDQVSNFNNQLLNMFDGSVVAFTLEELINIKRAVMANQNNLQVFDETLASKAGYLRRDPTSYKLHEAYGDIYAKAKDKKYLDISAKYYEAAIKFGGDTSIIKAKILAL